MPDERTSRPTHADGSGLTDQARLTRLIERLERALDRAPAAVTAVEQQLAGIETAERHLQEQFAGLQQTCKQAKATHTELITTIDQLVRVGPVADEKLNLLLDAVETGERSRKALQTVESKLAQAARHAQNALTDQLESVERRADGKLRSVESTLRSILDDMTARADALFNRFTPGGDADQRARALAQTLTGDIEELVEQRIQDRLEQARQTLLADSSAQKAEIEQAAKTAAARIDTRAQKQLNLLAGANDVLQAVSAATDRGRELVSRIESCESRFDDRAKSFADQLNQSLAAVQSAQKDAADLVTKTQSAAAQAEKAATQAIAAAHGCRRTAANAQETIQTLQSTHTQARTADESITTRISAAESLDARLTESNAQAKSALLSMSAVAKKLRRQQDALRQTAGQAEHQSAKLAEQTDRMARLTAEYQPQVEQLNQQVRESTRHADLAVKRLNSAVVNAGGVHERLAHESESGADLVLEMGKLLEHAESTADQLRTLATRASESVAQAAQRVADVEARSTHVRDQLDRATETTTRLADHIDQATQLVQRADDAAKTAQSASETARSTAQTLAQKADEHRRLSQTIAGDLEQGRLLEQTLRQAIDQGQTVRDENRATVEELTGKIQSARSAEQNITHAVQQAGSLLNGKLEIVQELSEKIDQGRSLVDQLSETLDTAGQLGNVLADLNQSLAEHRQAGQQLDRNLAPRIEQATRLHTELADTTDRAEQAGAQIVEQLAELDDRTRAIEQALEAADQFEQQADTMRVRTQQLETRADALQHQLNGMLSAPANIVADAKTQADRLQEVCGVVRKVFKGLSQTSLQANREIARFKQISNDANDKLQQITAETTRAVQTLREWVEEAAHIRSRLARTISLAPDIQNTHPPRTVERLADLTMESLPGTIKPGTVKPGDIKPSDAKPAPRPDVKNRQRLGQQPAQQSAKPPARKRADQAALMSESRPR